MQNPFLNLLGTPLVPKLGTDVAARSARHSFCPGPDFRNWGTPTPVFRHPLQFEFRRQNRTPDKVTLCIELGVHDVVINKPNHLQHGLQVVLHIGHLDIADGAAGRKGLELRLERQLGKASIGSVT